MPAGLKSVTLLHHVFPEIPKNCIGISNKLETNINTDNC